MASIIEALSGGKLKTSTNRNGQTIVSSGNNKKTQKRAADGIKKGSYKISADTYKKYDDEYNNWKKTGQYSADFGTWKNEYDLNAYKAIKSAKKGRSAFVDGTYYVIDDDTYKRYDKEYNNWKKSGKYSDDFASWKNDDDLAAFKAVRRGSKPLEGQQLSGLDWLNSLDQDVLDRVRTAYQDGLVWDITDPEDMARKAAGQMPKNKDSYYNLKDPLDAYLYEQGLPSNKSNYLSKQYQKYLEEIEGERAEEAAYTQSFDRFKDVYFQAKQRYPDMADEDIIADIFRADTDGTYQEVANNLLRKGRENPEEMSSLDFIEWYENQDDRKENPREFTIQDLVDEYQQIYGTAPETVEEAVEGVAAAEGTAPTAPVIIDYTMLATPENAEEQLEKVEITLDNMRRGFNGYERQLHRPADPEAAKRYDSLMLQSRQLQQMIAQRDLDKAKEKLAGYDAVPVSDTPATQAAGSMTKKERKAISEILDDPGFGRSEAWSWWFNQDSELQANRNFVDEPNRDQETNLSRYYTSKFMTEEEKGRFSYIVENQGAKAALEYWNTLEPVLNERNYEQANAEIAKAVTDYPGLASVGTIFAQIPNAVEGVAAQASGWANVVSGGKMGREVTFNDPRLVNTYTSTGIRSGVSEDIAATQGQLLAIAYDMGMSIADNAFRAGIAAVTGGAGVAISSATMYGSAAASVTSQYLQEGASAKQALLMGTISGATEAIGEAIDLSELMKLKDVGDLAKAVGGNMTKGQLIRRALIRNALTEGGSESATEIANMVADMLVMQDEAEVMKLYNEALDNGATKGQALWHVVSTKLGDVAIAGIGGAISGIVLGGGGIAVQGIKTGRAAGETGASTLTKGLQYMTDEANATARLRILYEGAVKDGTAMDPGTRMQLLSDLQTVGLDEKLVEGYSETFDKFMASPRSLSSNEFLNFLNTVKKDVLAAGDVAREISIDQKARREAANQRLAGQYNALMEIRDQARAALESGDLKTHAKLLNQLSGKMQQYTESYAAEQRKEETAQAHDDLKQEKANRAVVEDMNELSRRDAAETAYQAEQLAAVAAETAVSEVAPAQDGSEALAPVTGSPGTETAVQGESGALAESSANNRITPDFAAGVNRQDSFATATREERRAGKKLNRNARQQLRILDDLGKKYNTAIVTLDSIDRVDGSGLVYASDANGAYDPKTGTIYLALDAEQGAYLFFAVHELTHKIKAENPSGYQILRDFVLDALENNPAYRDSGITLEQRIQEKQAEYGEGLTDEEALEEVICDTIPVILSDESVLKDLVRTDRTLAGQIRDFFEDFYNTILNQLDRVIYDGNRMEAAALAGDIDTIRAIADLFNATLGETGQANEAKNAGFYDILVGNDVQYSQKANSKDPTTEPFSNVTAQQLEQMSDAERATELADSVIVAPEVDIGVSQRVPAPDGFGRLDIKAAKRVALELAEKFDAFRVYSNSNLEIEFEFSRNNLRESSQKQYERTHDLRMQTMAFANLEHIVSGAVPVETHFDLKDPDGSTKRVYVLVSGMSVNGSVIPVQLEIKEFTNAKFSPKLYVVVTLGEIKTGVLEMGAAKAVESVSLPAFKIKLADMIKNVNPSDGDFLMYLPDQMLTPEQVKAKWETVDRRYLKAVSDGNEYEAAQRAKLAARNAGYKQAAFHGTGRADRVGTVFRADRATSGPMAFFTDNQEIAENYARDKRDTSIAYDSDYDTYETQFRAENKKHGLDMPVHKAWGYIPFSKRNEIKRKAEQLRFDWDSDDNSLILDPDTNEANGGFQWQLKQARGNVISALEEQWLNSGNLFNEEKRFLEVLEKVGLKESLAELGFDTIFKDPDYREEKVYNVFLGIRRPFDATKKVTEAFIRRFEAWADKQPYGKYDRESQNADPWDKNNVTAEEFADRMRDDLERGTSHAWTSIPDVATDYLKHLKYDGIKDAGGKNGGVGHTVYIPFYSEQIKSADPVTYDDDGNVIPLSQRFNAQRTDIRYSGKSKPTLIDEVVNPIRDYKAEYQAEQQSLPAEESTFDVERALANEAELERVKAENERLAGLVSSLKEQMVLTKGYRPNEKALARVARNVLKQTASKYSEDELKGDLRTLFDYLGTQKDFNGDEAMALATQIARKVLEQSTERDTDLYDASKGEREYFRENAVYLSEEQKAEVARVYGSWNDFRKAMMGKIKFGNHGVEIDTLWQEAREKFHGIFDEEISAEEMPIRLAEYMNAVYERPYINPYGTRYDMDEASYDLAASLFDAFFNVPQVKTFADKQRGKLDEANRKYREEMEQMRSEYEERYEDAIALTRGMREIEMKNLKAQYESAMGEQRKILRDQYRSMVQHKNMKIQEAVRIGIEKNRATRERAKDRQQRYEYRRRIEKNARDLLSWLTKPTKEKHVPQIFQGYVADLLESIDIVNKQETERTGAWLNAVRNLSDFYRDYRSGSSKVAEDFYATIPDAMFDALDMLKTDDIKRLGDLSTEQLRALDYVVAVTKGTITNVNKMYRNARYKTVSETAESTISDAEGLKQKIVARFAQGNSFAAKATRKVLNGVDSLLNVDMLDAFSFGKMLGNSAESVIKSIEDGMERSYEKIRIGSEFAQKAMKDAGVSLRDVNKWSETDAEFKLESGRTVRMTVGQAMSIYALRKRPQALLHMLGGGIEVEARDGKAKDTHSYKLTQADLDNITRSLSSEQRKVMDALQGFLSNEAADWGNEAWQEIYLYEMFKEENYWPIKSAKGGIQTQEPDASRAINAMLNMGSTKSLNANANNPILIGDAFDTFTSHVAQMARLNGMAAPIEDAMKWYNYISRDDNGVRDFNKSTKKSIDHLMGSAGNQYFVTLIKDINGLSDGSSGTAIPASLLSNYKRSAVAANLRVVVQQPTSIVRALSMMSPKYFANKDVKNIKANIREMRQKNPLAWWKAQGNYEIGTGRSMRGILFGPMGKLESLNEKLMSPAGWADDLAWGWMWSAVKDEVRSRHPEIEYGSESYFDAVRDRFNEVVNQTQVVDSVLHRSQAMRSKDLLAQTATSFMSEPTKTYNMVRNATMDLTRKKPGAWKRLVRSLVALLASIVANNALKAVYDTFKNRKDGEEWSEKWKAEFVDGLKDDVKPWGYIPYFKDVASILEGKDVERTDLSAISDVYMSVKNLLKHFSGESNYTGYKVYTDIAKAIGSMSGLPVPGLLGTAETIANAIDPGVVRKSHSLDAEERKQAKDLGLNVREMEILADLKTGMNTNAGRALGVYAAAEKAGLDYSDEEYSLIAQLFGLKNDGVVYDGTKPFHSFVEDLYNDRKDALDDDLKDGRKTKEKHDEEVSKLDEYWDIIVGNRGA